VIETQSQQKSGDTTMTLKPITKLDAQKAPLIEQVLGGTQTDKSVSRDDVGCLIDRYFDLRFSQQMSHGDAVEWLFWEAAEAAATL